MYPIKIHHITVVTVIALLLIAGSAPAAMPPLSSGELEVPVEWAASYTSEEYAAIQHALWAGNFTLEDLNFKKNYTKGYQSFPVVLDMLAKPLSIAPTMDGMVAGFEKWKETVPSPIAEVAQSLMYYPGFDSGKVEQLLRAYGAAWDECRSALQTLGPLASEVDNSSPAPEPVFPFTSEELDLLRQYLPLNMSWHDVFESPYSQEQQSTWEEDLKSEPNDYIYSIASRTDFYELALAYMENLPDPKVFAELPKEVWPADKPAILETPSGRVGFGTFGDDEWEGDFIYLIDPGGNDHYINCRIGAAYGTAGHRVGYFADLGGNDFYDCGDVNITCGAAILGVAAFYDLGCGNDRYITGSCTLGAAMCGIATFYDDGGTDTYESKVYSQGAAGFGIGVMVDDSLQPALVLATDVETPDPINITAFDNDHLYAWTNSQAFARTLGVAICSNKRGNDVYEAGGVYLDAPLFADRFQSFSQGFAIGEREIDYAGGIALILDYAGNDRYLGDVYNQGVGYWYSAGFLYDGGGNDAYEMTQYGQGSGIHLAIGGLIDVSGNDSYTIHSGLGTGGSHDFAASILHDRGGNDQYFGNTSCNGGSLTNSAVLSIDRSGDDTYAGRRDGGINFGRPERGFISIGVLVDLGGNDDYLGIMDNGMVWTQTSVGVGWDILPPPLPPEAVAAAPPERGGLGENVPLPEIISYQGELTQDVFSQLWDVATRWAVGDNRFIVPKAIDRLIAFGPPVLPFLSEEFKNDRSGLAEDPFNKILKAIIEQDREGVLNVLRTNVASTDEVRRRVAFAAISELKTSELEGDVAEYLDDPDPLMQRRAIGVLGVLGSHVADQRLLANLDPSGNEAVIKVSLETLVKLDVYSWDKFRPLLDYPYITVRETLIGRLIEKSAVYEQDLRHELESAAGMASIEPPLSTRALRSILKVFYSASLMPDESCVQAISIVLGHEDWGVRADAVHVVRHWQDLLKQELAAGGDPSAAMFLESVIEPLVQQVDAVLKTETDPFVLFIGNDQKRD